MNNLPEQPYKGLEPYQEQDKDNFFGREVDKWILIDKLLTHKLTFLFAASGVGKSSLLQAAVIPELKQPATASRKRLDVLYHREWFDNPIDTLKQAILQELRTQKPPRIAPNYALKEDLSLTDFLQFCTAFTSDPWVIILDQFEEFFNNFRYHKEFRRFIEELATAIHDRETPTTFVIAMREDFALELNAFKESLPGFLIDNFYRLENLTLDKAKEALVKPLERFQFGYQAGLVQQIVEALCKRELIERHGEKAGQLDLEIPLLVEPPTLQIVCTQLWKADRQNPSRLITLATYQRKGGAMGWLKVFFDEKMTQFSRSETKLASGAFNQLVSKYSTKVPRQLGILAKDLQVKESVLEKTLDKLDQARVLRKHYRQKAIWYELYHDAFSSIVYDWNEAYKNRQRWLRMAQVVVVAAMTYGGFEYWLNATHYHFRLNVKTGVSDTVEIYQGRDGSRDWFGQQHYLGETSYTRYEIEADKLFEARNMGDLNRFAVELIKDFPLEQRITDYWEAGVTETALKTANQLLVTQPDLISTLAGFHTASSLELLATHLSTSEDDELKSQIITALGESQSPWQAIPLLRPLVAKESRDFQKQLVEAFKKLGSPLAVAPLVELLKDKDSDVQAAAAEALGELEYPQPSVFEALIGVLNTSQEETVRLSVLNALAQLFKEPQVVTALVPLLNDTMEEVQKQATLTLGKLGSTEAVPYLVKLLQDRDENTRQQVVTLLTKFGEAVPIPSLVDLLKNQESDIRGSIVGLLNDLKSNETVPLLLALLKDTEPRVRQNGVETLGQLATPEAITSLLTLLQEVRPEVRGSAVEALGNSIVILENADDFDAIQQRFSHDRLQLITTLLKDPDAKVRIQTVKTLGEVGSVEAVTEPWIESEIVLPLLSLVADPEASVRESTARVLGQLGPSKAVKASVKQEISKALLGLLKDKEAYVRSSAAEALGNLGDKNEEVVEALIGLLEDRYEEVRGKVVEALGEVGNEKAIGPLYNYWRESDDSATAQALASVLAGAENLERTEFIRLVLAVIPRFREEYTETAITLVDKLGDLGGEDSAKVLLRILQQQEGFMSFSDGRYEEYGFPNKATAAKVLGQLLGVKAIKPLVKLLKENQNSDAEPAVATVLGRTSSAQAVQPLVGLLSSENQNIFVSATLSLGQLANIETIKPLVETEAMKPLTKLLTHDSYKVRQSAGWTLSQLDGQKNTGYLTDILTDKDLDDHLGAMGALNQWESVEALPTLLKEVDLSSSSGDHFSLSAVNALYSLDNALAVQTLVENVENEQSRDTIIDLLGWSGNTEVAVNPLFELLEREDSSVRSGAAKALGKLGRAEAIPASLNLLKEENEEWVYEAAIDALDNLNSPALEELLLTWLTDPLSSKRTYAAGKLGTLGTVKAVPPLTALLQDPVSTVRGSAAEALGSLKVTDAIPLLTPLLDDPFSAVRKCAVQALSQLNHLESVPRFIALLKDPYPAVRQSAAKALGELKPTQAFPALVELLQDPEEEVLEDAILALGQLGQAEASQHLLPLLKDRRANIRRRAAQALGELGELGTPEAVPLLESLLTDYRDVDVRQSAAAALVQVEPAKAEERLKQLLKDPDSQMIQYALAELDALDSLQTVKPLVELLLYPDSPDSSMFLEETMYGQVTTALANLGLLKPDAARQAHQLQRLHTQATRLNPQQREAAATELGQIVSPHSVELLLTLLKDNHPAVKHQVLLSLKRLGELHPHLILPARPALQALTAEDQKTTSLVQKVLQKIEAVTPQTPNTNLALEQLKQIALNPQERLTTRSSAIKLLGKLGTADVANTLMTIADNLMKEVKIEANSKPNSGTTQPKPSVAPLLLFATYRALGNTTSSETTLSFLDSQLQQLAAHKQTWREVGRNKRWNYSQSELELGYAIARLNQDRGIELLSHDLAQVRKGAELALGRLVNVELLRKLTQLRSSNPPAGLYDAFFQQASLQTIDNLLTTLADKGGVKELTALKKWLPDVSDAVVKERVAWTVGVLGNKVAP